MKDTVNQPVAAVSLTFAITSTPNGALGQQLGAGASAGTSLDVATDSQGQAAVQLILGNTIGAYGVTATCASCVTGKTVSFTATATSPYRTAVLADSPAAYWRLDEASGTSLADSSGHNNTGAANG